MDESYVIPVLTELKEMRAKTYKLSDWHAFTKLKEDDCKFILSRAIELIEYLDGKLEDLDRFQDLAISRNNELNREIEKSTQLEQRIKVLTAERDLAKKLVTRKSEELKIQLNEKYGKVINCAVLKANLDKKCREVGELTRELEKEHEWSTELEQRIKRKCKEVGELIEELRQEQKKSTQLEKRCSELAIDRDKAVEYWTKHCEALLQKHREELAAKDREIYEAKIERDKNSDSVTYWRNLAKTLALYGVHATKETYEYYLEVCKNEYIDTDVASAYPKSIIRENNPCNFCGNCKHFSIRKDIGLCNNKHAEPFIVDSDDASCEHFQSNQVDRVTVAKPEFPCCDHCNREDCDNCTLCPF